jgi:ABC-type sugar transport system permease subunit
MIMSYNRKRHGTLFDLVMVLPALALFSVFIVWPAIEALRTSLFDSPNRGGGYIGLANYREMMRDPVFWIAMKNNLLFIACNLVFQVGIGTVFAALLDRGIRTGGTAIRTIIFAPLVIAPVAIGVIWSMLLEPNFGLVKQLAARVHLSVPSAGFLGNPDIAFYSIVAVGAWNYIGFMMTIMLAAMQSIPRDLYEAARLGGSSAIQTFFHITLPSVRQALILCALIERGRAPRRLFALAHPSVGGTAVVAAGRAVGRHFPDGQRLERISLGLDLDFGRRATGLDQRNHAVPGAICVRLAENPCRGEPDDAAAAGNLHPCAKALHPRLCRHGEVTRYRSNGVM